jgi:glycosyltransferase involved in cell wall biosynthesis
MRISFICPISPAFTDSDYEERGLGGNENTLVVWTRILAQRGHTVKVYVRGIQDARTHGVQWIPLESWDPLSDVDVLVSFRSVEPLHSNPISRLRAVFLGDRRTPGLVEACAKKICDLIICNSVAQKQMYAINLPEDVAWHIDSCGFDDKFFPGIGQKVKGRCIHTSAPYRGLENVLRIWPRIRSRFPYAELHITGGYQLWGYNNTEANEITLKDAPSLRRHLPGVVYHGPMRRGAYAALVRSAQLFIYPTTYEETCCIAALEASAAGAVPIVSAVAALKERVHDKVDGSLIFYPANTSASDDAFVETVTRYLSDQEMLKRFSSRAALNSINFSASKVVERLEGKLKQYVRQ